MEPDIYHYTPTVDSDYVTISGRLMFTSTDLSRSIQVQIIDDLTVELDEVFLGNLFSGPVDPGFTLSPENATVTIVNGDSKFLGSNALNSAYSCNNDCKHVF